MNWDQIKGDWHQLSHRLKEKWAKLINEELATIAGRRRQLRGSPAGTLRLRETARRNRNQQVR